MGLMAPFAGCRVTNQGRRLLSGSMGRLAVAFYALYALFCVDVVAHFQILIG